MLYLTVGDDDIGLNVLAFLPQVVLLLLLTYKYSSIYEVNFCLFCQTLVFVTFNKVHQTKVALWCHKPASFKVVTAQYFLWYLSLLPLILPSLLISAKQLLLGALLWGFAQVVARNSGGFSELSHYIRLLGFCLLTCWSSRGTTHFCSYGWRALRSSAPTSPSWQGWSGSRGRAGRRSTSSVICTRLTDL